MDKIAVLIPCYNESKTIKKVVEDYKEFYRKQQFMFMITILLTVQIKLLVKPVLLYVMSISRARVMLSEECLEKLMLNVIL